MSTILKALRRLEEQKSAASPRPLRDEVVLVPARRRPRSGAVVALVAAFGFAVLGGALVWLLDREPGNATESITASAPTVDVAAAPAAAPIAAAESDHVSEVTVTAQGPVTTAAQAPVVPVPVALPDFEVVHPRAQVQRAPAAAMAAPVAEQDDEVAVAQPSTAARLPDTEPGRVDETIPAARIARTQSPIRVERTQWHPSPSLRVAWVEVEGVTALREVREGERVGPYVVREIEPAAVLFADGSAVLRREVGP